MSNGLNTEASSVGRIEFDLCNMPPPLTLTNSKVTSYDLFKIGRMKGWWQVNPDDVS